MSPCDAVALKISHRVTKLSYTVTLKMLLDASIRSVSQCFSQERPDHLISNQTLWPSHMGRIVMPLAICATPVPHVRHYA